MSESFATSRPSAGAEEFERRVRSLAANPSSVADPLAELARLVGENDPFRISKPLIRATVGRQDGPATPVRDRTAFADFEEDFRGAIDAGEEPGAPDDPAVVHAPSRAVADRSKVLSSYARAPEISPDSWARGGDPAVPAPEAAGAASVQGEPVRDGGSSKRTLVVLAAVVALTGGGLAASFLTRPSGAGSVAASVVSTPTILAATGPSKVQPEAPAADPSAPSEPSTLLDKNKNDGTASAKVVNSIEQPVDLNQAVKPAPAVEDKTPTASSPFPEPRKVKTVLVRPDGSIITDRPAAADPAMQEPPASQPRDLAFDPKTSLPLPASQPPAAAPATPAAPVAAAATPATPPASGKSQARVAVTPKGPGTSGDSPAAPPPHAAAAAPKVKPPVPAKPAAAPVQEADAAPPAAETATASLPSGTFAAQLGAGGSEAEAKGLSTTLSRKYADAVGGRLSIHKAQSGAKTVYRVRVSGLSQEAARAVCAKVTAGGGGCFVARD